MALLELEFADHVQLKKKGRNFQCVGCPKNIQKLRRCREDRWDFTEDDASFFPIRIHEGGGFYGFCPGKATWDQEAVFLFKLLVVSFEQKALLVAGGIADQPAWFIEQLGWFVTAYDSNKFTSRARMILGEGGGSGTQNTQGVAQKNKRQK